MLNVMQINNYTSTRLPIRPTSIPNYIMTPSPLQRPVSALRCWSQNCSRQSRILPCRSDSLKLSTSWSHWQF